MTLFAKNGARAQNEDIPSKDDETLHSYTRFTSPADIKNTQLLFVDRPQQEDPQLLYLPALKRIQRISHKKGLVYGKRLSIFGSGVIAQRRWNPYNPFRRWKELGRSSQDPKNKQYKHWITTISKTDYLPYTIEYYAKRNPFQDIVDWRDHERRCAYHSQTTIMTNHKRAPKHTANPNDRYKTEIPLDMFTPQQMEKWSDSWFIQPLPVLNWMEWPCTHHLIGNSACWAPSPSRLLDQSCGFCTKPQSKNITYSYDGSFATHQHNNWILELEIRSSLGTTWSLKRSQCAQWIDQRFGPTIKQQWKLFQQHLFI